MPTLEQARAWYPARDPIHGFDHVERVYRTAERLALEEGADLEIVRAAALLHDVQGAEPEGEHRADHHEQSARIAAEVLAAEGWPPDRIAAVQECIRAHRFRVGVENPSLEARILFDADKLDVLGAVGVARTIAYAVLAGQPHYHPPSERFLTTGEKEPGEPHSAYHEYLFKLRKVKDRLFTASARRIAERRHADLVAYFEALAAEMEGRQ
ncbi:MAG TPA: HD domain-containing protein [Chloroflexi bacterium]|jgi:uncharacterized protein|nr:HD domain-containing protein [Chloroflexota bacterium]HPO59495.1 HD domain-containing protein [Anaerolineaceae bacterium]